MMAASRGLGRASALALAREGVQVCITARDEAILAQTASELRAETGSKVMAVRADAAESADLINAFEQTVQTLGPVDILVNNAGGPPPGKFVEMDDDAWFKAFTLNFMSAVRLCQLVLPDMCERGWGRIINITSIGVKQPLPDLILSNAVRTGLVAMAKTLSAQVAEFGVTVNNICPGYTLTDRIKALAESKARASQRTPEEVIREMEASILMGRMGTPSEFGALVAYLASEQASYITGASLPFDGGSYQGLM
ncbi:MAG: SDR family oxidoreductase [Chloroflexi bacterium]|nr:SDR family oxidoreductase [Chloroflexota bacterium]